MTEWFRPIIFCSALCVCEWGGSRVYREIACIYMCCVCVCAVLLHCRNSPGSVKLSLRSLCCCCVSQQWRINKRRPRSSFFSPPLLLLLLLYIYRIFYPLRQPCSLRTYQTIFIFIVIYKIDISSCTFTSFIFLLSRKVLHWAAKTDIIRRRRRQECPCWSWLWLMKKYISSRPNPDEISFGKLWRSNVCSYVIYV